ncbi:MAG: 30S ribosomal protein S20 [bacterium]|nr:MAG: 30S ribosomal protein S20 [bacterium]
MAHTRSALKRIRQSEKRNLINRSIKSKVKTLLNKVDYALKNNQEKEAQEAYKSFVSALDKAVQKGTYHKNTAARKKSGLMKKINSILK